jgi:hypothetical protein
MTRIHRQKFRERLGEAGPYYTFSRTHCWGRADPTFEPERRERIGKDRSR